MNGLQVWLVPTTEGPEGKGRKPEGTRTSAVALDTTSIV
jgi:hypothetical protein